MNKFKQRTGLAFTGRRCIIAVILFVICTVCSISLFHITTRKEIKVTESGKEVSEVCDSFSDDAMLFQSFFIRGKAKMQSVSIRFATFEDAVTVPSILVSIRNKRNQVLFQEEIATSHLIDNEYYKIKLGGLQLNGLDRYYLTLQCARPNGDSDITPTVWLCENNSVKDVLYQVENRIPDRVLCANFEYETIPIGLAGILGYGLLLVVLLLICSLHKKQLLYLPAALLTFLGAAVFINIWKGKDAINAIIYHAGEARKTALILLLLLGIVCAVIWFLSGRKDNGTILKIKRICYRFRWIIGIAALLCLAGVQFWMASNLYQKIGWDVLAVFGSAKELAENGTLSDYSYLSIYPNNQGLVLFMSAVIKLTGLGEEAAMYWHLAVSYTHLRRRRWS